MQLKQNNKVNKTIWIFDKGTYITTNHKHNILCLCYQHKLNFYKIQSPIAVSSLSIWQAAQYPQ